LKEENLAKDRADTGSLINFRGGAAIVWEVVCPELIFPGAFPKFKK
jgi:hypothetical protein